MLRDLWDFLVAVFSGWVGVMAGIFSVLTTAILYATGWQGLPLSIFGILALIGLVLAFFRAWRVEREVGRTERARREKAEDQSKPELQAMIWESHVVEMHEVQKDGSRITSATVIQVIEIKNLGADSVVEGWAAWVEIDGRRYDAEIRKMPQRLPVNNELTFHGADQILYKVTTDPIRRGAKALGTLWLVFPRVPMSQIDITKIQVQLRDLTGRAYVVHQDLALPFTGFRSYPGLKTEIAEVPILGSHGPAPVPKTPITGACQCGSGLPFGECHGRLQGV